MSLGFNPPPVTANIQVWAQNIVRYLQRTASRLQFKPTNAPATEEGTILWDAVKGYPVVAKDNEWHQIMLADGNGTLQQTVDVTAAAADTAYKITLQAVVLSGITLTGSPLTDITFDHTGLYLISFTAQIISSTSSSLEFRFWPRVNGVDITGSTIVASLHTNGATSVVARSAIFSLNAGDVLNIMWATTRTDGSLKAFAATAYAPGSPSVTLGIIRIRA